MGNPIIFIDPSGSYVDASGILAKDKKGNYKNPELAEAFLLFAKSDLGIAFLAKFAAKGQVIAGHKYEEAGEFHQQGFDINFSAKNLNYSSTDPVDTYRLSYGPKGRTEMSEDHSGGLYLDIQLNSERNSQNPESVNFFDNPDDESARNQYILRTLGTIFHEAYIHAIPTAQDKSDDCILNCSNFTKKFGNKRLEAGTRNYNQHKQAKKSNSQWVKTVIPKIIRIFQANGSSFSPDKIKHKLLDFNN